MRVSICIPTVSAKRSQYLREAIASAAAQTHTDFEIVLSDNSADPAYHAVVDGIVAEFPQVEFRLLRHQKQLDAPENINSMIDASRGDGWLLLPDDDLLCPTFVARASEALDRHPGCGFTFADHWIMDSAGNVDVAASEANTDLYSRRSLREGVYPHETLFLLALKQAICLQTMVIRREVLATTRFPSGIICGDLALALKIAAKAGGVDGYYLKERVFKYRLHGEQITSTGNARKHVESAIAACEACGDVPVDCDLLFREKLADNYLRLALIEAEAREMSARKHAMRSLQLAPSVHRALRATLAVAMPWAITPVRRVRAALSLR